MRLSLLSLALLAAFSSRAVAHEKGAIHLASKQVPVGGELVLRGERLPKNATLRLELRGTLETFPLSEVRTDAAGKTQTRLALPAEARMGSYKIVVVAADGDVVAQADLVVVPAAATADTMRATDHAKMSQMDHSKMNTSPEATDEPHATPEMMPLDVTNTAAEWVAMIAIIVAAVAGGVALLVGARHT